MELDKNNYLSVLCTENLGALDINKECVQEIMDIIKRTLISLNISLEGKSIYYQRNSNKISMLAIKLADGEELDVANYMFNGADARSFEHFNSCDVFLHADAKVGQSSLKIAGMISRDIVRFFNQMEAFYLENGMADIDVSFKVPLSETINKDNSNDTGIRRLIKRFFVKRD